MKVDLPVFLLGLFLFISALGMMSYLIFALVYDDTNYDNFPVESLVFGFGLFILAICLMFYMGSYFISSAPIDKSTQQSNTEVMRK